MMQSPSIQEINGRPALVVDGKPFLAIGAEWDFRNSIAPERSEFLYEQAAAMNCTTAFVPVLWSQVEPEKGRFDFAFIDRQIELAAANHLKLVPLWFGSNRGGSFGFVDPTGRFVSQVPRDIVADLTTYRRAVTPDGRDQASLCPNCGATLVRETAAFRALLNHLSAEDRDRTVVMMQVENEVSTPDAGRLEFPPRCCCAQCNALFSRAGLTEREFGDRSYGDYVTSLVEAGAAEYALPMYVNFVSTPRPGENVAYYLEKAPHLASCAPDIYARDTDGFARALAGFAAGRNVPLVAETSSNASDPTDRNIYHAVTDGGSVGFVLWAIDCAYGYGAWEPGYSDREPLVDPRARWSPLAKRMRDEFAVLRSVMGPLLTWRGTDRLDWFTAGREGLSRPVRLAGIQGMLKADAGGRGILILTAPGELTASGHGFSLQIRGIPPGFEISGGTWDEDVFLPSPGPSPAISRTADSIELTLSSVSAIRLRWKAGQLD